MEFTSTDGDRHYAAVVRARRLVVGLDFDGTLAPIVEDPDRATIHPDAPDLLLALAHSAAGVAVITGRPVRQVLELGRLDRVAEALDEQGADLQVLGQYGNERWSSRERRVLSPEPPRGVAAMLDELPELLRRHDAQDAWIEEKGLAIGIHTRRLDDPQAAFERLLGPVRAAAETHDLIVEPGRLVIEVRAHGMDKGSAVRRIAEELRAEAFIFVGDDLGDVAAFRAVRELRDRGLATFLVCSGSQEEGALRDLADAVVDGVEGVIAFLRELVGDLRGRDSDPDR